MASPSDIENRNAAALAERERVLAESPDRTFAIKEMLKKPPYTGFVAASPLPGVEMAMFLCANDDGVALRWMWDGVYERMSIALWTWLARRAGVVVDIGAHTGAYSLAAAVANGDARVISLEPHALNFARLLLNLRANGLTADDAFNVAVSEEDGMVPFTVNTSKWYLSQGGRIGTGGRFTQSVPSVNLDNTGVQELGDVALVKIDTEGHELQVLKSMKRLLETRGPDIFIESVFNMDTTEMETLLRAHGYAFHAINDRTLALEPVESLAPTGTPEAPDRDRLNRFVCKRPAAEVEALAGAVRDALDQDG